MARILTFVLGVALGAAAGVGKTYRMLEDAHQLKEQGIDVVVAVVETHGRVETEEQIKDLEIIPPKKIPMIRITLVVMPGGMMKLKYILSNRVGATA